MKEITRRLIQAIASSVSKFIECSKKFQNKEFVKNRVWSKSRAFAWRRLKIS